MSGPILACRPVEWPSTGPLADFEPSTIYTGSIVKPCESCGVDVYLGPRQQEADGRPHCFLCAAAAAQYDPKIVSLDNPEGDPT